MRKIILNIALLIIFSTLVYANAHNNTPEPQTPDQVMQGIDVRTERIEQILLRVENNVNRPQMIFGATDYFSYEARQTIFVQLLDGILLGQPIDNAICRANVWNEEVSGKILDESPMVFVSEGIYHLHVNIMELGVHPVSVRCFYEYNSTTKYVNATSTTSGNFSSPVSSVNFTWYDVSQGQYETSQVQTLDGTLSNIRHDWDNKYAVLNTTTPLYNGTEINTYNRPLNKFGEFIYFHDITGTIIYANFTLGGSIAFFWNNVTLNNIGASGITTIYVSDLGQGGAHDVDWDYIQVIGQQVGGDGDPDVNNSVTDLQDNDDIYWQISEDSTDKLQTDFTFSNVTGVLNGTGSLLFTSKWSDNLENVKIYIYNPNTLQYDSLPTEILYSTSEIDTTNTINNISTYIDGTAVHIRLNDSGNFGSRGFLELDTAKLLVSFSSGTFIADVKGGGEIHIINASQMSADVWTHPDRQLTEFNFDVTDEEQVWQYANRTLTEFPTVNATINTSLVTQDVWQYNGTIVPNILNQFASSIWSFTTRILTAFGFDVVDEEAQSDYVWNASGRYTHGVVLS